jgi:hypothetical protein
VLSLRQELFGTDTGIYKQFENFGPISFFRVLDPPPRHMVYTRSFFDEECCDFGMVGKKRVFKSPCKSKRARIADEIWLSLVVNHFGDVNRGLVGGCTKRQEVLRCRIYSMELLPNLFDPLVLYRVRQF